jgi:hypothetical protein
MEAVGHDPRLGKIPPDHAAVGAGKIDADDLYAFSSLEFAKEFGEVRLAFSRTDVEDPGLPWAFV